MKILVLQLLRYGDILMAGRALQALRRQYPDAQIDLMVNEGFERLHPLLPFVNKMIVFPRKYLQDALVQLGRPLFEPFDCLQKFIQEVNQHKYDKVVNLSQTKLSGYLTAMIHVDDQKGLSINQGGQAAFGSPWFKYLNDVVGAGAESFFHFSDVYYYGVQTQIEENQFQFFETEKGRKECEAFFSRNRYTTGTQVVIQPLTSDAKKNWSAVQWAEALAQFAMLDPQARFIFLAGPGEETQIEAHREILRTRGLVSDMAVLSFEGALTLLNSCDLLITADTSIKHLAAGSSISIIELSLGGSDLRKTGVYKKGSLILKSKEACAPCGHAGGCTREKHFCSMNTDAIMLGTAAFHFLNKDRAALRKIAEAYDDQTEFYITDRPAMGFWYAENILSAKAETQVADYLDRLAWRLFLEKEHLKKLAAYGSESLLLKDQITERWGQADVRALRIAVDQLEAATVDVEMRLSRLLSELARRFRTNGGLGEIDFIDSNLKQEIETIEKEMRLGQFLSEKIALQNSTGLYRFRQLQISLNEAFQQQQIKIKLLRTLKTQLTEYQ